MTDLDTSKKEFSFAMDSQIFNEFSVDEEGKTFATQSAVARLCGVQKPSVNELIRKIALGKSLSKPLKSIAGKDYSALGKIPDIAIAAIVTHYAMYARNTTERAKEVLLAFQAIGIRSWIQKELGWQPGKLSSFQEDLLLANFVQRSMIRCGVKEEVAEQIVLSELSKMHPSKSPLLLSSKNTISANNPLPDAPLTPTEVGIELTAILGYKVSARKVNKKLLALGYQISITRTKRSNKKEVHHYYKATSKGEQHSTLLLNAYSDGEGKATQPQLKWYRSIVSILKNNWD